MRAFKEENIRKGFSSKLDVCLIFGRYSDFILFIFMATK